jgi:hypothetical protein
MSRKELTKAIAYFRTSSETNVGADKDSLQRQRQPPSLELAERGPAPLTPLWCHTINRAPSGMAWPQVRSRCAAPSSSGFGKSMARSA